MSIYKLDEILTFQLYNPEPINGSKQRTKRGHQDG
jgi:hypothetical protein